MTASNNWWIELMLEKESSWRTWYWVRDSQNLFGWGWKCRHLIYLSGLKHWVSRCAIVFFVWDLEVLFSCMVLIAAIPVCQSQPANVSTSLKQRAVLVDEIWHAAGDSGSDIDWYVKRTVLGGIYSTSEVYMLTDNSPGLHFSIYSSNALCWFPIPVSF